MMSTQFTLNQESKKQGDVHGRCFLRCVVVTFSIGCCLTTFAQAQTIALQLKAEMGEDRFRAAGLHKLTEEELLQLRLFMHDGLATGGLPLEDGTALVPRPRQRAEVLGVEGLEGGSIVAQDGTFLGRIDRSRINNKSLSNRIGAYGSRISTESILNRIGPYGSRISSTSPFNRIASHPPKIFDKDGEFVGYLTINKSINPRIDPNTLLEWLGLD